MAVITGLRDLRLSSLLSSFLPLFSFSASFRSLDAAEASFNTVSHESNISPYTINYRQLKGEKMETRGLRARASEEAEKRTEAEEDDRSGEHEGRKAGGSGQVVSTSRAAFLLFYLA